MLRLSQDLAGRLGHWKGRPDFLGAWLDLALESRTQGPWTEFELQERWQREWSTLRVRLWCQKAKGLGLLSEVAGERWRVLDPASDHLGIEAGEGKNLEEPLEIPEDPLSSSADGEAHPPGKRMETGGDSHVFESLARGIADAILTRLPALRDLAELHASAALARITEAEIKFDCDHLLPIERVERSYVLHVLERVNGNKSKAAEILGLDPSTLYRKLNRWGVV